MVPAKTALTLPSSSMCSSIRYRKNPFSLQLFEQGEKDGLFFEEIKRYLQEGCVLCFKTARFRCLQRERAFLQSALMAERPVVGRGGVFLLRFVRNRRAKRYILRVLDGRTARVTVPWGGDLDHAVAFWEKNRSWVEDRMDLLRRRSSRLQTEWRLEAEVCYRGRKERIVPKIGDDKAAVGIGDLSVVVRSLSQDLRPEIEAEMWAIAKRELPILTDRLAKKMMGEGATPLRRITVRNQRTRWGSCSCRGTISLNWRLIQIPPEVCEYVILHELCHLRHMNHSPQFWAAVGNVCPEYEKREAWLKTHNIALLSRISPEEC